MMHSLHRYGTRRRARDGLCLGWLTVVHPALAAGFGVQETRPQQAGVRDLFITSCRKRVSKP
jgi:hypothetical protein